MISNRLLIKWRKESLHGYQIPSYVKEGANAIKANEEMIHILHERILRLTQELMDQHLLNKE